MENVRKMTEEIVEKKAALLRLQREVRQGERDLKRALIEEGNLDALSINWNGLSRMYAIPPVRFMVEERS